VTVTLGNTIYGVYLDKEQAFLDAIDAAAAPCKPPARPGSGVGMARPQRGSFNRFSATRSGSLQFGRLLVGLLDGPSKEGADGDVAFASRPVDMI
jgi:hypothetical protein